MGCYWYDATTARRCAEGDSKESPQTFRSLHKITPVKALT
jgi:hypothetical protein